MTETFTSLPNTPPQRPTILVTRPEEDAAPLVRRLQTLGYDTFVEPMLTIAPIADAVIDLQDVSALLFTSANGVRTFTSLSEERALRVYAVGPATSDAARAAGFSQILTAGGDVTALAQTVANHQSVGEGVLFHAAGSVTAGDLAGALGERGYTVRRVPLYQAVPRTAFSDTCKTYLTENKVAAVTFFSPRTAKAFARLLQEEGIEGCARTLTALCLSRTVADASAVSQGETIEWHQIRIADTANTDSLLLVLQNSIPPHVNNDRQYGTNIMADDRKNDDETTKTPDVEQDPVDDTQTNQDSSGDHEQTDEQHDPDAAKSVDADAVIDAFGGIRPMASKLGVAVSTVQGWKARSHIPENRWRDIIAAAGANGVDLSTALPDATEAQASDATHTMESDSADDPTSPWESAQTAHEKEIADETPDVAPTQEIAMDESDDQKREESHSPRSETPSAPQATGGGKLALVLAAAALVAVVARPVWAPHVDPLLAKYIPVSTLPSPASAPPAPSAPGVSADSAEITATIEDLRDQITALRDQITRLPAQTGDAGASTITVPPEFAARLASTEENLASLSNQLGGLATQLGELEQLSSSLSDVEARAQATLTETQNAITAAEERDAGTRARLIERQGVLESLLEQSTADAERMTAAIAVLESRLSNYETQLIELQERPVVEGAALTGLALAVGDVERTLLAGHSFAAPLNRLSALASNYPDVGEALAPLRTHAANGVQTLSTLSTSFSDAIPQMQTEMSLGAVEDEDLLGTIINGASSLITIRKKGEEPQNSPLSRAEGALARGDIVSAIAALQPHREASASVDTWLNAAEAHLSAVSALNGLRTTVTQALQGGSAPATSEGEGDAS